MVSGTSTAALTQTSVADGTNDSFVASYASDGTQSWIQQLPTLASNQANAISVDASGNIYVGGSVSGGVVGSGQTSSGGGDASSSFTCRSRCFAYSAAYFLRGRMGFGDCTLAHLPHARRHEKGILVMAHLDTVHPIGTLEKLPFRRETVAEQGELAQ